VLKISGLTSIADFFVICTAESRPQMQAIREAVETALSRAGSRPLGVEGLEALVWVLLDYDDVIVHIFDPETRTFYGLDRLWGDAPRLSWEESPPRAMKPEQRPKRAGRTRRTETAGETS
jgi:ribosome-associated protein